MLIRLSKNRKDIYLLELAGSLDLYSSAQLKECVMKIIRTRIDRFIFSLKDIDSINSAGIGALIYAFSTLRKLNCTLTMLIPEGPVLEALEVSRLKGYFTIAPTLKDALEISDSAYRKNGS